MADYATLAIVALPPYDRGDADEAVLFTLRRKPRRKRVVAPIDIGLGGPVGVAPRRTSFLVDGIMHASMGSSSAPFLIGLSMRKACFMGKVGVGNHYTKHSNEEAGRV